jgi:hypothetical protein
LRNSRAKDSTAVDRQYPAGGVCYPPDRSRKTLKLPKLHYNKEYLPKKEPSNTKKIHTDGWKLGEAKNLAKVCQAENYSTLRIDMDADAFC